MDAMVLACPGGISACLGVDGTVAVHDRRRLLARRIVGERLHLDPEDIHVERDAPTVFGYHTRLFAYADGRTDPLPVSLTTATDRDATVVAACAPPMRVGLDIRSAAPDPATLAEVQRHFPLWGSWDDISQLTRWSAVQAILDADARGTRVHPEHVRLDVGAAHGGIPDRAARYEIVDLSRSGYLITLAYGVDPT